jgi:prepilin-type N-terminal cleavage/methylation domain-containing protein
MKHKVRKGNGFTLIELLVTTVMIAVLTVIGIVSYSSVNKRSRDVKRKSDLEQIRSALEMCRSDSNACAGAYPGLGSGNAVDAKDLNTFLVPTYIPAVPDDSNTALPYKYQAFPAGGPYTTYCVFAYLETLTVTQSTCTVGPPSGYNYGLKSP